MFNFIKYRKVYYSLSSILILMSLFAVLSFGLKLGIDFTGGSIMDITFRDAAPDNAAIKEKLSGLDLGEIVIQPTGDKEVIIRMKDIDTEMHSQVLTRLGDVTENGFEKIGPTIGKELTRKTYANVLLSLVAIVIYIAIAFGRLSWPAKSWQYSIAALVALFHDIIIPLGVFAVLGRFYGIEITIPIIAALLTVLGYSVHDTVVVFDRIRENLLKRKFSSFEETVNQSLNQTLARSVTTVLTVLLTLFSLYFFGGETLKDFSLALIIGVFSGMYSSIFIASPLMVSWVKWKGEK